jgi:hypothetical protein
MQPERASEPEAAGIAQTERVVLLVLGGLLCFAGFVVLLLHALPNLVQLGVGVAVAVLGAGLCVQAVRPAATTTGGDLTPSTLLAVERLAFLPVAVLAVLGCAAVLFGPGVAWPVRLLVGSGSLALAVLVCGVVVRNTLPGDDRRRPHRDRR